MVWSIALPVADGPESHQKFLATKALRHQLRCRPAYRDSKPLECSDSPSKITAAGASSDLGRCGVHQSEQRGREEFPSCYYA